MRSLMLLFIWALLVSLTLASTSRRPVKREYSTHNYYVLEHDPSLGVSIEDCAAALGAEVVEPAGELQDFWLLRAQRESTLSSREVTGDAVLRALETLRATTNSANILPRANRKRIASSIRRLIPQVLRQRVKRHGAPSQRAPPPPTMHNVSLARAIAERLGIIDPLFPQQWHLVNEDYPEHMLNATPVWDMGITGEGVIAALVDDGLDYESDDIADNFDAVGSYDFNDHVDLPTPMLWDDHHGTRCGGQIAAVKNSVCGMGIAYKSKIAGLRILSGPISDIDEAAALNYGYQNTSIYSCSWGPSDDGRSMAGPNYLIAKAMLNGVQNGRGGKGSVFVFASGNGAWSGDQCNFDGYTNSIYSLTVAAIDHQGKRPLYSEACAANMVVTYSSNSELKHSIVTTDVGKDKCTSEHGGTSAAAPNAVGVFALALSARPELTWRDIQHLCAETAEVVNPEDPDWEVTAAGRMYGYKYGFGKLDAYAFVTAAQKWKLVKPQAWVEMPAMQLGNGTMDSYGEMSGGELIVLGGNSHSMTITPRLLEDNNFEALEHVTVDVWISHTNRGDVEVELISPHGIRSVLAGKRRADHDSSGFPGWKFMTVKHWGENPVGEWTIRVSDQDSKDNWGNFLGWSMTLWGSTIDPTKYEPYVLPWTDELPFPPPESTHTAPVEPTITEAKTTKSYLKPTVISTDVMTSGEASQSASTTQQEDLVSPVNSGSAQTSVATSDGDDRMILAAHRKIFFGAAGGLLMLSIVGGVFVAWRCRTASRTRGRYAAVSDDENVRMNSIDGGRRVSLLDHHGLANDEYDADEESGLGRRPAHEVASGAVGFHSGFLDDDDPDSTAPPAPLYRDAQDVRDLQGGAPTVMHL